MTASLVARLRALDACAVSDALDALGINGVADGIRPLASPRRIAGEVITVDLDQSDGTKAKRHLGTAAVDASGPGSVIVVGHRGRTDVAGWGGVLSAGSTARGAEGVLVDGAVRDVDEANDLGLPVYGRNGTPRTARGRVIEKDWNVPIEFAGVTVEPGDLVIADRSGVVFVPRSHAENVLERAELIVAKETKMGELVREGRPMIDVMTTDYETMLETP